MKYRFNHISETLLRNVKFLKDNRIKTNGYGILTTNTIINRNIIHDYMGAKELADQCNSTIEDLTLFDVFKCGHRVSYWKILNNIYFRYFNKRIICDLLDFPMTYNVDLYLKYRSVANMKRLNNVKSSIRAYDCTSYSQKFSKNLLRIVINKRLDLDGIDAEKTAKFAYGLLLFIRENNNFTIKEFREFYKSYGLNCRSDVYKSIKNNIELYNHIEKYLKHYSEFKSIKYNGIKYETIRGIKKIYSLYTLCQLLDTNPSGYILDINSEEIKLIKQRRNA